MRSHGVLAPVVKVTWRASALRLGNVPLQLRKESDGYCPYTFPSRGRPWTGICLKIMLVDVADAPKLVGRGCESRCSESTEWKTGSRFCSKC